MDEQKEKQNAKKKRSALPIYAIGIVWLLYAGKLNTFRGILSCAVVSAIVYAILRIVLPGKKTDEPPKAAAPEQPQPKQAEKKPEPQPEPEPEEKLPPELQSVIYQGKRAIADIRRLNDEIPDERISAQIDLIERLTAQIFDCVRKNPKKLSQIRQFLNYYLPTDQAYGAVRHAAEPESQNGKHHRGDAEDRRPARQGHYRLPAAARRAV